jgi:hypothetical protein
VLGTANQLVVVGGGIVDGDFVVVGKSLGIVPFFDVSRRIARRLSGCRNKEIKLIPKNQMNKVKKTHLWPERCQRLSGPFFICLSSYRSWESY